MTDSEDALPPRLLNWFDRHRRALPWRADRDPYRIWVSEVMLQQTTVATVSPIFEKFLLAFPNLAALATADEQDVLRLWEGLGYYRRARHLHASARQLMESHSGQLPDDPDLWASLPGVGRYILGAVLSQAFDRRLPIVEANSQRVLCRLFGQRGDPKSSSVKAWLWAKAEEILPQVRVGDFNQALMELGALVCTPSTPKCGECPLATKCVANRLGAQEEIPSKSARPTVVEVSEAAVVVSDLEGRVLLTKRPENGRWSNMWEFPHTELGKDVTHAEAVRRLMAELGFQVELGTELMTIRHTVMHYRIRMVALEAQLIEGAFDPDRYVDARWVLPSELADYPVSSPQRKLADAVANPERQKRLF